jgi:hypothetical protein
MEKAGEQIRGAEEVLEENYYGGTRGEDDYDVKVEDIAGGPDRGRYQAPTTTTAGSPEPQALFGGDHQILHAENVHMDGEAQTAALDQSPPRWHRTGAVHSAMEFLPYLEHQLVSEVEDLVPNEGVKDTSLPRASTYRETSQPMSLLPAPLSVSKIDGPQSHDADAGCKSFDEHVAFRRPKSLFPGPRLRKQIQAKQLRDKESDASRSKSQDKARTSLFPGPSFASQIATQKNAGVREHPMDSQYSPTPDHLPNNSLWKSYGPSAPPNNLHQGDNRKIPKRKEPTHNTTESVVKTPTPQVRFPAQLPDWKPTKGVVNSVELIWNELNKNKIYVTSTIDLEELSLRRHPKHKRLFS